MTDHPPAPDAPSQARPDARSDSRPDALAPAPAHAPSPPAADPRSGGADHPTLAEIEALWHAAAAGAVPTFREADALQWGSWLTHLALAEPCRRHRLVWRYACPVAAALLGTPLPEGTRLGSSGVAAEAGLADLVRDAVAARAPVRRKLAGQGGQPLAALALPVLIDGSAGAYAVVLRAPPGQQPPVHGWRNVTARPALPARAGRAVGSGNGRWEPDGRFSGSS